MDLTAEDDDLLSYFLAADVTAALPPQLQSSALETGTGDVVVEPFTVGQTVPLDSDRTFACDLQATGTSGRSASSFQQTSNGFAECSMMRPMANDDDSLSNVGALDTDEKRQRRLARNRESARQSRRRKKQYLELLEERAKE